MTAKRYAFLLTFLILLLAVTGNALAATYYLATNGSDSYSKTQAQNIDTPWQTFQHAESQLSPGDTVVVRGGTYSLGCVINVPNVTFKNYPGETPVIDGAWVRPGTGKYAKLVWITASDVTWDGINIRRSSGTNIYFNAGPNPYIYDVTLKNCKISEAWRFNLVAYKTTRLTITGCDFYEGAHFMIASSDPSECASLDLWSCNDLHIAYNKIHGSLHDGLIIDANCTDGITEYNTFYGNSSTSLYIDNAYHHTVRYNLIYGLQYDPNNLVRGCNGYAGNGIYIGSESEYGDTSSGDHLIYGNLVAGCQQGLTIGNASGTPPVDCKIYNNTFIQSHQNNESINPALVYISSKAGGGHIIENNIFWQTDGLIAYVASGKATFDYNLWSKMPPSAVQGVHDPPYAEPDLRKMSGWDTLTAGSLSGPEFAVQASSPAIGAGKPLTGELLNIPECDNSDWLTGNIVLKQNDAPSGPVIGADFYQSISASVPDPPTKLEVAATE